MPSTLPWWRARTDRRYACLLLTVLPAVIWQAWRLDQGLFARAMMVSVLALAVAGLLHVLTKPRPSAPAPNVLLPPAPGWAVRSLDALLQALLVSALWSTGLPLWPLLIGLGLALVVQQALGGWAVNPFSPALLAIAIAIVLARTLSATDFNPPLNSLLDTLPVAAGWLLMGLVVVALRLWPARASLTFLLVLVPVLMVEALASINFVTTAILATFVVADTRTLPSTAQGQYLIGGLAGLAVAALWLNGAPPLAAVFPLLLVQALSPWVEHLSLRPARTPDAP